MDLFIGILSSLTCFFILMGNFKISRLGEEQEKRLLSYEKSAERIFLTLKELGKELDEGKAMQANQCNSGFSKDNHGTGGFLSKSELESIPAFSSLENGMARLETRIDQIENLLKSLESDVRSAASSSFTNDSKDKSTLQKNGAVSISFAEKVSQKYKMVSTEEKLFLNGLFRREPGEWHKTEDLGLDAATSKFLIPMVCRKMVFSGIPVIKMKDVNGIMKVLWGDGIKDTDIQVISDAFSSEVHV
jgi:hypothetical protein